MDNQQQYEPVSTLEDDRYRAMRAAIVQNEYTDKNKDVDKDKKDKEKNAGTENKKDATDKTTAVKSLTKENTDKKENPLVNDKSAQSDKNKDVKSDVATIKGQEKELVNAGKKDENSEKEPLHESKPAQHDQQDDKKEKKDAPGLQHTNEPKSKDAANMSKQGDSTKAKKELPAAKVKKSTDKKLQQHQARKTKVQQKLKSKPETEPVKKSKGDEAGTLKEFVGPKTKPTPVLNPTPSIKLDENKIKDDKKQIDVELKEEKKQEEQQQQKTEPVVLPKTNPVLTPVPDTSGLKKDAELQKTLLREAAGKEEQKLSSTAALHRKAVDKEHTSQATSVTNAYDKAIARVRQSLKTAQVAAAKGKVDKRNELTKNGEDRKGQVDKITIQKQKALMDLSDQYGKDSRAYAGKLTAEAYKKYTDGKATISKNAENAIAPYVNHDYYADVKADVHSMADDMRISLAQSTHDLKEQLTSDANDLAAKFHDDAVDGASHMPDGKEASKKNIANTLAEGLKQFDSLSAKPLQDLSANINKTIAGLQKSKKEALDSLHKQKEDAVQKINSKQAEGKKSIHSQRDQLIKQIDTITGDTEKELTHLKPQSAQKLIAQAGKTIRQTSVVLGQTSLIVQKAIGEQQSNIVSGTVESLRFAGKESAKNADETADNAEKGAKGTSDGMISTYSMVVEKLTGNMDGELTRFGAELDKTILKSKQKWDTQQQEGEADMATKAKDVMDENDQLIADSRQQLIDQAKDSSEISLWDVVEAIASFVWGALKAIALILAVILLVLAAIALLAVLFELLLAALVALGLEALAFALAILVDMAVAFIVELLASLIVEFIVLGVVMALKQFYDTATNKNLTRNQKAEGYGEATVNLIASFLGGWGESKGAVTLADEALELEIATSNVVKEEVAVSNIVKDEAAVTNLVKDEAAVTNAEKNLLKDEAAVTNAEKPKPKVASGVKEDPMEFMTTQKTLELNPKQQGLLEKLAAKDELGEGLAKIGKREVSATDLAALTKKTGNEYAIVLSKDGDRVLVDLKSYKGGELPSFTESLLIHSHPDDLGSGMANFISPEDIQALEILNQKYSYMVTVDGKIWKFTKETAPLTEGDLVRDMDYLGWFNPQYPKPSIRK